MRTIVAAFVVLLLSACSTTVPLNYIPSSSVRGDANVATVSFRYVPAESGEVAPNQFQKNSASIGEIYTGTDIATFVEAALKKELSYSGFTPRRALHRLTWAGWGGNLFLASNVGSP